MWCEDRSRGVLRIGIKTDVINMSSEWDVKTGVVNNYVFRVWCEDRHPQQFFRV